VFLARKTTEGFAVDRFAFNGVLGPQGAPFETDRRRQVLRATLASLLSSAHVCNPSAPWRWLFVGLSNGLNALLHLDDVILGPSRSLKGINLGSDADFSSHHTSDFPSHPARGAADPRVHEDMTVFGRGRAGFQVVEKGLFSPKDLNGT
tara:strand:- start:8 stop:454 length:447 start_codon:yes stop_codon:yes gene_type:complete